MAYIFNGGAFHSVDDERVDAVLKEHAADEWRLATDEEVEAEEARQGISKDSADASDSKPKAAKAAK